MASLGLGQARLQLLLLEPRLFRLALRGRRRSGDRPGLAPFQAELLEYLADLRGTALDPGQLGNAGAGLGQSRRRLPPEGQHDGRFVRGQRAPGSAEPTRRQRRPAPLLIPAQIADQGRFGDSHARANRLMRPAFTLEIQRFQALPHPGMRVMNPLVP